MKKISLLCGLVLTTLSTEKLAAQCEAPISRTAYDNNGPCELPVVLRVTGSTSMQAVTWYENGNLLQAYKADWAANQATRYAGASAAGAGSDQLNGPSGICFDREGNLYIADKNNHRIQKWAPGAASGTTVAGNGTAGNANNQLDGPTDVFADTAGNLYIADANNHRIQKWNPGANSGTTVAGNGTAGNANNQLSSPSGVFVDGNDDIFIADAANHRIQKWVSGANSGTTVAGNGTAGSANNQLNEPTDVYLDPAGNIYIADKNNHRIQRWASGAASGTMVAGDGTAGNSNSQLNDPKSLFIDGQGNIYITDGSNMRVQLWEPNASSGTMVANHTLGARPAPSPLGVALDSSGNLYMADFAKNQVFAHGVQITDTLLVITPANYKAVVAGFNGCIAEDSLYVTALPDVTVTPNGIREICQGAGLALHTSPIAGLTYQWHRNGTDIPQATDSIYTAETEGIYTVTIHNGPDCSATSEDSVALTINPLPEPVITEDNGTLSVSETYSGYQWHLNGNAIQGATGQTQQADGDGDYTITVTDENGCTNTSAPLPYALSVGQRTGLPAQVSIYPNPAQSFLYFQAPAGISVSLITLEGKFVLASNTGVMNISALPDGLYLLHIKDADGRLIKTEKLVKSSF